MTPENSAVILPAVIGAIIFGLKRALGSTLAKKYRNYIPGVAIVIGMVISWGYSAVYDLGTQDTFINIAQGIVVGAAAVGYREAATRLVAGMKKTDIME